MSSSVKPPFPAHAEHAPLPRFFGLMRATTLFLAATLLMQAFTAGQLLSNEGGRQLHDAAGGAVSVALVLQVIAAFLVWRVGHESVRYLVVSASMVPLTGVQFVVGASGDVAIHVPLGVALFGAGTVLAAQVWWTRPARTAD
ncbi:hypothetical protein [Nonomuraea diastatica]|uniref:Integral membrane protein n=1 Tax=Nonomuraea diastatica TaxID=1848329 RepID=A0A4R4WVC5_9ACTN|nr:hypothetical protein [Nonomuraea diastatica]TDD21578.1 hypothetical protein E1294_14120 [Nonomuraea diastatica]